MKTEIRFALKPLALIALALSACQTARDVAVTSFHVIDAPANYVRRHIDQESTTTPAVTGSQSDVVTPGHPIVSPTPAQRTVSEHRLVGSPSAETGTNHREMVEGKPKPAPSPHRNALAQMWVRKFLYAKPVPGKPGYVFSPFDPNGGYVDVTGYASGSKAKDPYSGQIFIVP